MRKQKGRGNHRIAVIYLKKRGYKLENGSWNEILTKLCKETGEVVENPGVGSKKNAIAILKQIGLAVGSKKKTKKKNGVNSLDFLESYAWRKLRMVALIKHSAQCQCCGRSRFDGVTIHVDHILPRKTFPKLALDIDNLQVLCHECNHGKGNWDKTDWRGTSFASTNF